MLKVITPVVRNPINSQNPENTESEPENVIPTNTSTPIRSKTTTQKTTPVNSRTSMFPEFSMFCKTNMPACFHLD